MSQYDDFTVYIFGVDLGTLQSLYPGKEGSLYGLWTSTLNPVVHVVHTRDSYSGASESQVGRALAERYKMSFLGEWRVVSRAGSQLPVPSQSVYRPGQFYRFLVLEICDEKVWPYMFDNPAGRTPKRGSVEVLEGENPFHNDVDTKAILRGVGPVRMPAVPVPTGGEAYERHWEQERRARHQHPAPSQRRQAQPGYEAANTSQLQWYAGDGGEKSLKLVYSKIKKIADRGDVQMSRDKTSQDMTLSFRVHGKDWVVEFPYNFPKVGAKIKRADGSVERTSGSTIEEATDSICRTVRPYGY